ncbi:hypothetical protein HT031_002193 [Scenedesmus sp. PABB004]|nr:hypothetical protein HT031_002193 [Scenedesmus sp. PABB004]
MAGRRGPGLLLRLATLLAAAAAAPPAPSPPPGGVTAELFAWYPAHRDAPAVRASATPAFHCLASGFLAGSKEAKVYSQYGEDGLIEFISSCVGAPTKTYVEFGVESCSECTTRALRKKGWKGLLLDGGHEDPLINLHKHFLTAENIASLFGKYGVPRAFDHLTVDVDLNTPYLLRAVLAAGYRPRQIAVEYNRNFAPNQSYAVLYSPEEMWTDTVSCYYGASGLAMERIAAAFNYSLVAVDDEGVNLFFVDAALLGLPFPHSFASLTPSDRPTFDALHGPCRQTAWVYVDDDARLAGPDWLLALHPLLLSHSEVKTARGTARRAFREAASPWVLQAWPCGAPPAQEPPPAAAADEALRALAGPAPAGAGHAPPGRHGAATHPRQARRHACAAEYRHLLAEHHRAHARPPPGGDAAP